MYTKITKKQFDLIRSDAKHGYIAKDGDKVFMWDNVKIKKKEFDEYFKHLNIDIKRVKKIKDANVILVGDSLSGVYATKGVVYFNTVSNKEQFLQNYDSDYYLRRYLESTPSQFNLANYLTSYSRSYHNSYDIPKFRKDHGSLFTPEYVLKYSNDRAKSFNLENIIGTVPIYYSQPLVVKYSEWKENRETEEFEELDITTMVDMLLSNDDTSVETAISMLDNFNLKDHYGNLLITLYCGKANYQARYRLHTFLKKRLPVKGLLDPWGRKKGDMYESARYFFNTKYFEITKHYPVDKTLLLKLILQKIY